MKKYILMITACLVSACNSSVLTRGNGQIVYHWERANTGIEKFARDHSECLRKAESFHLPSIKNWFISEEARYNIRADWHSEKGIWASYVPYAGAQPLIVNSIRDDSDVSPKKYRVCMESRGYWHRQHDIPTISNIFIYRPQDPNQDTLFEEYYK